MHTLLESRFMFQQDVFTVHYDMSVTQTQQSNTQSFTNSIVPYVFVFITYNIS